MQIERRPADDLEHVCGGGLLLQGLGQIVGARLYFVEQTDILDRNYRLVGEGLDQVNLPIGKWLYCMTSHQNDDADWISFAQ